MATGLSFEAADDIIKKMGLIEQVNIACINSPDSVTLSGSAACIAIISQEIRERNKFCRVLETGGRAYHSPMMKEVGALYENLLAPYLKSRGCPKTPYATMYSTVGYESKEALILDGSLATVGYWRDNLESPVQFSSAIQNLISGQDLHLIEIGPHSALKGPIHQILDQRPFPYTPTLVRNLSANLCIKRLAATLFSYGHKLNWEAINSLPQPTQRTVKHIPPYPWDYSNGQNWFESRAAIDMRNRPYPRHELLGSQQMAGNGIDWSWRNLLRLDEIPWVCDHKVDDQIVFPAAAYLTLAIEAVSQIQGLKAVCQKEYSSFMFQNVSFNAALVLTGDNTELHTIISFRKLSTRNVSSNFYDFSISSWKAKQTVVHCAGSIRALQPMATFEGTVAIQDTVGYRTWSMDRWYEKGRQEGLLFGPHLQSIVTLHADSNRVRSDSICATHIIPPRAGNTTTHYPLHPIVIDACLQAAILSAAAGNLRKFRPYLPVFISECRIQPALVAGRDGEEALIHVRSQTTGISALRADSTLRDLCGIPIIDLKGVRLSLYNGKLDKRSIDNTVHLQRHPIMHVHWKPDVNQLHAGTKKQLDEYIDAFASQIPADPVETDDEFQLSLGALLDLAGHKNPRMRVLDFEDENRHAAKYWRNLLDHGTAFPRYRSWNTGTFGEDGELVILGASTNFFDVLVHMVSKTCFPHAGRS